jgi:uncharacterized protein (DUF2461 family)
MPVGAIGPETLAFLRDLGANNNRDWFQAHYDAYQRHPVEPAHGARPGVAG